MVKNMEVRPEAKTESRELPVAIERALPVPRRVKEAKAIGHPPAKVLEMLAANLRCNSEFAKDCVQAGQNTKIADNIDYYKIRWGEPLHGKFAKLVGKVATL